MLFALVTIVSSALQPIIPGDNAPAPSPRVEYIGSIETGVGNFQSFADTFPNQPDALLMLGHRGYAVLQLKDGRVRDAVPFRFSIPGMKVHRWQVDSKQVYFIGVATGARQVAVWDSAGAQKWLVSPKFPKMEDSWLGQISAAMVFPAGESAPEVHLVGNGNDSAVVLDLEGKSSERTLAAEPEGGEYALVGPLTGSGPKSSFAYYLYGGDGKVHGYKSSGVFATFDVTNEAREKKPCYISSIIRCPNGSAEKPIFHVAYTRPSDPDGEFGRLRLALDLEQARFLVQEPEKAADHDPYGTIKLPDRSLSLIIATKSVQTRKASAKGPELAKIIHTLEIRDSKGSIVVQTSLPELDKAMPGRGVTPSVLRCHDMANETMVYIGVGTSVHRWKVTGLPTKRETTPKP